jgi:transglutaminase-like putative cysteine protease
MSSTTAPAALQPAEMVDADHPAVRDFAHRHTAGAADDRERAVRLYYAVRDGFRYDAYDIALTADALKGSAVLASGHGWCVNKAALLAAACRVVGVPARIGLADVRNHLSTARLREYLGTDVFYCHGYTSIALDGAWVKATPAFNIELCHKLRLQPLEFDGTADSIYHPCDLDGQRHMEYLRFRGEFDDVPRELILGVFAEHYPRLAALQGANWAADVTAEASSQR